MRTRGFTLVEVVVATAVIVLILGVLALSLRYFFRGTRNLELRQQALTLATLEMLYFEDRDPLPEPYSTDRTDTLQGVTFRVRTFLAWSGQDTRLLRVRVSRGDSVSIELMREFIINSREDQL